MSMFYKAPIAHSTDVFVVYAQELLDTLPKIIIILKLKTSKRFTKKKIF